MKPLRRAHIQQALEVLAPEDFMPPSPNAQARFDALPDDDPWKVGLRAVEARAKGECRDCRTALHDNDATWCLECARDARQRDDERDKEWWK